MMRLNAADIGGVTPVFVWHEFQSDGLAAGTQRCMNTAH